MTSCLSLCPARPVRQDARRGQEAVKEKMLTYRIIEKIKVIKLGNYLIKLLDYLISDLYDKMLGVARKL